MNNKIRLNLWSRYMAFVVDFLIPTTIELIVFDLILMKLLKFEISEYYDLAFGLTMTLSLIFKDITGNSIGKRFLGLKIVSWYGTGKPRMYQLILRNIIIFLLPIEAIMVIVRADHLRIGDFMAETKVVRKNEIWS